MSHNEWAVHVSAPVLHGETTEATWDSLTAALERYSPALGLTADGRRLSAQLTVLGEKSAPDAVVAAANALEEAATAAGLVLDDPDTFEVQPWAEFERAMSTPEAPDIVSAVEAAEILGVSRQRLHQLRAREDFPTPLYELRTGPLWTRAGIELFGQEWTRRPGRPPASSAAG
ncbi:MAG: hypothetical protein ACRDYU_03885 [Actinomycetes bacterium]